MDPRHPEQAISRMRELMKQYDRIEKDMNKATTSAQLGQLEREGGLVVQEICLVAPRIHEAMMQTSRQRRHDLSRGILIEPQDTAVETPQGGMFEPEIVEKPVENYVEKDVNKKEEKVDIKEPYVNEISVTPSEAAALVDDLELVSTDTKISDDKMSIEIEHTYKPKKKATKKKTTKKAKK